MVHALSNSPKIAHQHAKTVVMLLLRILVLVAMATTAGGVLAPNAQVSPVVSIQFTNVTSSAGIKFVHFKGNNGISINREEFGPGLCVADFDGDGWQDIYFVNDRDLYNRGIPARHALYRNIQTPYVGRGVAFADFDNDGFIDVIVANNGDPPLLLHNSGGNGNHFLNFKLVGTKSNRDAMGARIRLVVADISQIREIAGGGSYLSQSDLRANFGLGKTSRVESVEVTWPSGQRQLFRNVEADRFYLIEEGKDQLQVQQFGRKTTESPVMLR